MVGQSSETREALLKQRVEDLEEELVAARAEHAKQIAELSARVASVEKIVDSWKSGFLLIVTVGGFLGWLASVWDKVTKWH